MWSQYSDTYWERLIKGNHSWVEKAPFLGKKKVARILSQSAGHLGESIDFFVKTGVIQA